MSLEMSLVSKSVGADTKSICFVHWVEPVGIRQGRTVRMEFDSLDVPARAIYPTGKPIVNFDADVAEIIHPAVGRIRRKKGDERAEINPDVVRFALM